MNIPIRLAQQIKIIQMKNKKLERDVCYKVFTSNNFLYLDTVDLKTALKSVYEIKGRMIKYLPEKFLK